MSDHSRSSRKSARRLAWLAALAMTGALAAPAPAVTYYLDGVTFSDGTTATGSFSTGVSGYLDGWTVQTQTGAIPGHLYTNDINATYAPGDAAITFYYFVPSYGGYIHLALSGPIDAIVGSAPITAGEECADYSCVSGDPDLRTIVSGRLSLTAPPRAVPEPAAWALMIAGLGTVGATLRRQRVRVAFG